MNLSTTYLGLNLSNPLMPGACPLADNLDTVKQLEDAGAGAVVMHSLFEEQLTGEHLANIYLMEAYADSYAEALSYFPRKADFAHGPDAYLEQIAKTKKAIDIPVIASLNGTTPEGWTSYATQIQQAGADALELNIYHVATDPEESGRDIEQRAIDVVRSVSSAVTIPVAVKLSPFFSALTNFALELQKNGADGLVVFNRFYQPDIDVELLEAVPSLKLSDSAELLLRLRWLAVLSRYTDASLAVTGGVHTFTDAVKSIMAGAHTVQLVSALLEHGPGYLKVVREQMVKWMEEHGYHSVQQMRGSMSLSRCPDPQAFERANYMRILQSWKLKA